MVVSIDEMEDLVRKSVLKVERAMNLGYPEEINKNKTDYRMLTMNPDARAVLGHRIDPYTARFSNIIKGEEYQNDEQ